MGSIVAKEGGVKAVEKQREKELRDLNVLNLASICAKDFIIDFVLFFYLRMLLDKFGLFLRVRRILFDFIIKVKKKKKYSRKYGRKKLILI